MIVALSRLNFRDVGGLPTADGGRLRAGVMFRSEGPASFVDEHHAELSGLGFRTVVDLRSSIERTSAPHRWCGPECRLLDLDLNTDLRAAGEDLWAAVGKDPSAERTHLAIRRNYELMPEAFLRHVPAMVEALLGEETPMMVHCTAGKDRTGVVVGMFLDLAGVSRDAIIADYRKSDVFAQNQKMFGRVKEDLQKAFGFVPSDEMIDVIIGVRDEFITGAFDVIARQWGGIEGYFQAAGINEEARAAVRTALVSHD